MIPARCFPGLSHEQNMAKMRLLTFMGMAVEFKELSFDTMQQELQIGADDVEAFVIDGMNNSCHVPLFPKGKWLNMMWSDSNESYKTSSLFVHQ